MGKRVEYIELFWRCRECGQDHISAIPHLNPTGWYCPNCFFRRDESVELYEASDSRVITDPDLIARIEEGRADWKCKHCGSLNADTGVPKEMLVCEVCDIWQTDENDKLAPLRDEAGEVIAKHQKRVDRFEDPVVPRSLQKASENTNSDRILTVLFYGAAGAVGLVSFVGIGWLLTPHPIEVEVKSLPWEVAVEVQQLLPVEKAGWEETVPTEARILSSETRQRGTQEVQYGTKTVMVTEQYQSGMRTETYTEFEQYQSGTRENCTTTSTGTGAGKRTCTTVPVYSSRPVQRTRQVPQYSTRQVPKIVPNMVTEPVYDNYVYYEVTEWQHEQTLSNKGEDNEPRIAPVPKLDNVPYPERTLPPVTTCKLMGVYQRRKKPRAETWEIPCAQFDQINKGDRVKLQATGENALVKDL